MLSYTKAYAEYSATAAAGGYYKRQQQVREHPGIAALAGMNKS
jgi:hypothetical protein